MSRRHLCTRLAGSLIKRAAGLRTAVSSASTLWDGRRDGKEVQENANTFVDPSSALPPVSGWVCPQAREMRVNKRTKRQSGLTGTFGLDITNTHAQTPAAGAAGAAGAAA